MLLLAVCLQHAHDALVVEAASAQQRRTRVNVEPAQYREPAHPVTSQPTSAYSATRERDLLVRMLAARYTCTRECALGRTSCQLTCTVDASAPVS